MTSAYAGASRAIFKSGLGSPLPVSTKHKGPLVAGHHGPNGTPMTKDEAKTLANKFRDTPTNVGIALVPGVVGIDVDAHSGKRGAKSLRKLVKRYGELPPTWVSTSRDLPSGIMLYRTGKLTIERLPSSIDGMPDIDLVSRDDMYVMCAPSIHPKTGEPYHWIWSDDESGEVTDTPPKIKDLPKLPKAWRRAIEGAGVTEGFEAASPASHTVIAQDDEDAVAYAVGVLEGTEELRGDHANRHKAIAAMVLRLTFNDDEEGIAAIKAAWFEVMPDERGSRKEATREWNNIVRSAGKRADEPSPPAESPVPKSKKPSMTELVETRTESIALRASKGFPMEVLPTKMRKYAEEIAHSRQVPLGLVVPGMIASVAAASAGGIVAEGPDGFTSGLAVYFIGVANSSERKSAVLKTVIDKPLEAAFAAMADDGASEFRQAQARVKVLTRHLAKLEGKGKDATDDVEVLADAQLELDMAVEEEQRLRPPQFIATDATPEALEIKLAQQNGIAVMSAAEGGFIENLSGRYGEGVSLSVINQAWGRESIYSLRVNRGESAIPVTHLVIAVLVQDSIAEKLAQSKFETTGMLSRVFFTAPESKVGHRTLETDKVSRKSKAWWYGVVNDVLHRGWGHIEAPGMMTLSSEAHPHAVRFFYEAERMTLAHGIAGWWGKALDMAMRVAAILQLAENPQATVIEESSMTGAVEIVRFFAHEAQTFYLGVIDPFLGPEGERLLKRIAKHIDAHYKVGDEFTTGQMRSAMKSGANRLTAEDVDPLLAVLVEIGTIEEIETKRRDTRRWKVLEGGSDGTGVDGDLGSAQVGYKTDRTNVKPPKGNKRKGVKGVEHRGESVSSSTSTSIDFDTPVDIDLHTHAETDPFYPDSDETGEAEVKEGDTLWWEFGGERYPIHVYAPERDVEFRAFIKANPRLGFDTETTGLRTYSGDTVRLVQFANADEAWVVRAEHVKAIQYGIEIANVLYAHNAGFDVLMVAEHLGVLYRTVKSRAIDTAQLVHLLDPRGPEDGGAGNGLKANADKYLGAGASDSEAVLKEEAKRLKIKVGDRFRDIPIDNVPYNLYAGADAILVYRLGEELREILEATDIAHMPSIIKPKIEVTEDIEAVVLREKRIGEVTWDMKQRGIKIDRDAADDLHDVLTKREATAMEFLVEWGIDSPNKNAQVAAALEKEGVADLTKRTAGGAVSVAKSVLDKAEAAGSEVASQVAEAKRAKRHRTVYVDGLLAFTDADDYLHADIRSLRAITGRMSVSEPPLQQIPADVDDVRRLFVPSKDNRRIVTADFSQIEARVLAALADDVAFYDDVVHGDKAEGTDIHSMTARIAFGDDFTDNERDMTKRIVFGKLYGGGVNTLAASSGASHESVNQIIAAFNTRYKGVKSYGQKLETKAKGGHGFYMPSGRLALFGRDGEYKAMNYMIQGTARDLYVDAVLRLVDAGYGHALLLPVHDEVLLELPAKGIKKQVAEIADVMSGTFGGVALPVGVGYGKTWGDAKH